MVDKKAANFLQKLKEKAAQQKNYGGNPENTAATMDAKDCANCGAGRAKTDGLTHCAYCDFEFISTTLTDGIYISKDDNSKK